MVASWITDICTVHLFIVKFIIDGVRLSDKLSLLINYLSTHFNTYTS